MELLTRVKSFISHLKSYFTIKTAFFAYLVKCLVIAPTPTDAFIMVALICSHTVYKYYIHKTPDPSVKIQKEIENLKGAITSLKLGKAISRGIDEKVTRKF